MATVTAARTAVLPRAGELGVRFDWLVIAASAWLLGGLYWDGWAHGYGLPDSFWTIWHAAFYSGYAAAAAVIFGAIARARPQAATWRAAIPAGYEAAVAGVVVFGLGIALIVSGPLLAAWRRGRPADWPGSCPRCFRSPRCYASSPSSRCSLVPTRR
jgi:hypothetical protein